MRVAAEKLMLAPEFFTLLNGNGHTTCYLGGTFPNQVTHYAALLLLLVADCVHLDVLRRLVARPAAAHQLDGARVEGGQDRTQRREFRTSAAPRKKLNNFEIGKLN